MEKMMPAQFLSQLYPHEAQENYEDDDEDSTMIVEDSVSNSNPVVLEGTLQCRRGKSSKKSTFRWKKRFVVFNFEEGGSITLYKKPPPDSPMSETHQQQQQTEKTRERASALRTVYTKLHRKVSMSMKPTVTPDPLASHPPVMQIPPDLPWIAKDVYNDPTTFVIEIPTTSSVNDDHMSVSSSCSDDASFHDGEQDHSLGESDLSEEDAGGGGGDGGDAIIGNGSDDDGFHSVDDGDELWNSHNDENYAGAADSPNVKGKSKKKKKTLREKLDDELIAASDKGKPLRIYFRCNKRWSNEKALWLRAFSRLQRLSNEIRKKNMFFRAMTSGTTASVPQRGQVRRASTAHIGRDMVQLDMADAWENDSRDIHIVEDVAKLAEDRRGGKSKSTKDREFRVEPTHAYPHRWMTIPEMRQEMLLPSEHFHDLKQPGCDMKQIGSLKVEVLQCLGLPKLDRTSETDAVVYLVCGQYAFSTDVIMNRANPMWLRKSRRAAIFPLHHGYARLYVGVFDDNQKPSGKHTKDDFAGRVVLDLARLRPRSTYDVIIPLRLSTHVYSRRRRGAIRLRFTLHWNNERDALLSYIPDKLHITLPQHSKANHDVTVLCADHRSFRNIAFTVHGAHLPGRFTFQQMRAAIREMNFTRKFIFTALLSHIRAVRCWDVPAVSAFLFLSWMHCVYANAFSLVPGYVVLYILLNLARNYAFFAVDGCRHRGFIPPSWEELFMALANPPDSGKRAIEPIDLGMCATRRRSGESAASDQSHSHDFRVKTHRPQGKKLFRSLGLMPDRKAENGEDHREFPFAGGTDYPRFLLKDSLVDRKGDEVKNYCLEYMSSDGSASMGALSSDDSPDKVLISRFALDMDGLTEDDAEESNFKPRTVVVKSGKKAASKVGDMTGLNSGISAVRSGVKSGVGKLRRTVSSDSASDLSMAGMLASEHSDHGPKSVGVSVTEATSLKSSEADQEADHDSSGDDVDPYISWPDQNIDIEGPTTGKTVTEDLNDTKDKIHDLTWHWFDDAAYSIKNPDAVYFGDAKKPEKRRKDVNKELDKLLGIGQYSNSNPFVARFGLYVEPIIEAMYSFLCFFRAAFNAATWQDPILTFWISIFLGVAAIILFIFPWRLFFLVLGWFLVGPQNWVIRILREKGKLPPAKPPQAKKPLPKADHSILPTNQQCVIGHHRQVGNSPPAVEEADPREAQHVVVPYGPLLYQRFYDWPPEPQFANVKRVPDDEPSRLMSTHRRRGRGSSFVNGDGRDTKHMNFLRRRLHRRNKSDGREGNDGRDGGRDSGRDSGRDTGSAGGLGSSQGSGYGTVASRTRARASTGDWQSDGSKSTFLSVPRASSYEA